MKTLLRSLFVVEKTDNADLLLQNYRDLLESGLGFEVPEYNTLWHFVRRFVQQHGHVPDVATLRTHFKHTGEDSVYDQVEVLSSMPARAQGDFKKIIEVKVEDRRLHQWTEILKEAGTITSTGIEIKGKKGEENKFLKGPIDAARYVSDRMHDIVAPTGATHLSGEVTGDDDDFVAEYERVESDPLAGIGQFTYIQQMDDALGGAKRHELWLHAAFTGGLKSTFLLNWVYNQAVYFGQSSVVFSLEMPYKQCRRILYAIHSMHPKFRRIRHQLGLQSNKEDHIGLPYQNIRDGTLHHFHPNAKKFLLEYVVPDFKGIQVLPNPDEDGFKWQSSYGKIHIEVTDPSKNEFTVPDLRSRAEVIYAHDPFTLLAVDHAGLMDPRKSHGSTTENLNEVLRDLKKLAMAFNRGMGMAVVALFQISREGYKAALKSKKETGKPGYNLTHLSYANEAERSSDIVTATWVDEDTMKENRVMFQCLKSRDQKPFDPFVARVEWPCRRLLSCRDTPRSPEEIAQKGAEIDEALKELDA